MRFLKSTILFLFITSVCLTPPLSAKASTAGSSAELISADLPDTQSYEKTIILRDFLNQYDSPLAPYASSFIKQAELNRLDWKLVASISGVESYFGQQIPPNSYNGWGFGVFGPNVRYFTSWDDGISTVSQALRRDYINSWHAKNVYEIGSIYAEDPAWANKVTNFMTMLTDYEAKRTNSALSISL